MIEATLYTCAELEALLSSGKTLPHPDTVALEFTSVDPLICAADALLLKEYVIEYQRRKIVGLQRQKKLLRRALQETMQEVAKAARFGHDRTDAQWYVYMPWQNKVLRMTEDK